MSNIGYDNQLKDSQFNYFLSANPNITNIGLKSRPEAAERVSLDGNVWDEMREIYNNRGRRTDSIRSDKTMDVLIQEANTNNNGRVNTIEIPGGSNAIAKNSNLTGQVLYNDTAQTSVKGMYEETLLTDNFFSDVNMKVLNYLIMKGVKERTGETIGKQSQQELITIMRSILLQYGDMATRDIVPEIKRLNSLVVKECVDSISVQVQQYKGYVRDLNHLPIPIDLPQGNLHKQNYTYDISNLPAAEL